VRLPALLLSAPTAHLLVLARRLVRHRQHCLQVMRLTPFICSFAPAAAPSIGFFFFLNVQCLGQKYAMNHIMLFMALTATLVDWQRVQSPNMDDLDYVPTIVPKDGAMVHMKPMAWPPA